MEKPKIRFKGYQEDWEQRKLGHLIEDNIIMEQSDGNHGELYPRSDEFTDAGIPYIAASAISSSGDDIDFNLVKYLPLKRAEQFRKGVAQNGDILLAHNATVGPCLQLSMEYNFAILSTSLTLFRINENKMNSKFFLQMLRSDLFQNQLFKYMKQTTRSQVPILTQRKLEVCYPSNRQEQELIGTYLSNLDRLITLHQRKCEETKILKKYMLQKMFPQNGHSVPEIRFSGFTEDWEQRKYAEVIELLSGQDFNPEEYNEDGIGIPYLTGASCIENGCTTAVRWTEKPRCVAEKGDTVLVCKGSGYGTIATVNQEKAHIARQFMALKVQKHELDNRFNYFLLNSVVENIKTDARGLIAGIARDAVLKQEIVIPCLNEQTKIGEYFDSLDHLITLHQQKCNELRNIKKFMLQNMFI